MLDLGLSFLASVARDPNALAIADGELRLTYAQWYRQISALVKGFDAIGLKAGDHLVTVLQNRAEAATLHWACQFAGIVITPVNWRSTASELDFYLDNAEAKAVAYEDVSAAAVAGSALAQRLPRIAIDAAPPSGHRVWRADRASGARCHAARRRRRLVGHALHLRHHGAAEGRAAPPVRRARRGDRPCRAKSLPPKSSRRWRTHARRHAALSHHGRALAAGHVARRRRLRLPAPLRRRERR